MMIFPIETPAVNLLLCLNNILVSTVNKDWYWKYKIFAVNTEYHITFPIFRIDWKNESDIDKSQKPDVYLMNLDEMDLKDFIRIFYRHPFFNPKAKYILYGLTISHSDMIVLTSNFVIDVIFLNTLSLKIFTFFPFVKRMIWKPDIHWKEIISCQDLNLKNYINLFENKIPSIWTQSTISILYFFYPPFTICKNCQNRGYEIDLLEEVLMQINVTTVLKELKYPGPGFNFMKNSIFNKTIDIVTCDPTALELDFIYPYIHLIRYWMVPTPQELPQWKNIFYLLNDDVWTWWATSLLILLVVWVVIDHLLLGRLNIPKKFWIVLKMSIEQSISKDSVNWTKIPTKLIFGFILLFLTFMMATVLKAGFPYLLSGFNFGRPIENVKDIMDKNLLVGSPYHDILLSYFSDNPGKMNYFNNHFTKCDFSNDCLHRVITRRDLAIIVTGIVADYSEKSYRDETGRSLVRKLSPQVMRTQMGANLLKGNPIIKSVNRYFLYFDQHGIKQRIESFYAYPEPKQIFFQIKRLSLKSIGFPFLILVFGFLLALIVFFVEYTYNCIRKE